MDYKSYLKIPSMGIYAIYISVIVLLAASTMVSVCIGRYPVTLSDVLKGLFTQDGDSIIPTVIMNVRMPRIIAALVAGGVLSLAGSSYQAIFRNPMVSPDILGVSSGAACGAAIAIMMSMDTLGIQLTSFLFGLLAVSVTISISKMLSRGKHNVLMLILSGMIISSLFGAVISLMKYIADPDSKLPAITFWMMGSLNDVTMEDLKVILPVIITASLPLWLVSWKLNILSFGDEEAKSLGVNPDRIRLIIILCSTMITASVVSLTGLIGWVGLIIPHLCRFIIGADNRKLLPFTFLTGALFLLWIDNISRTATALEIPIGIITSIIGAPLFLFFLWGSKER